MIFFALSICIKHIFTRKLYMIFSPLTRSILLCDFALIHCKIRSYIIERNLARRLQNWCRFLITWHEIILIVFVFTITVIIIEICTIINQWKRQQWVLWCVWFGNYCVCPVTVWLGISDMLGGLQTFVIVSNTNIPRKISTFWADV